MRNQVIAPLLWEREKWEQMQKNFIKRCRKEDEEKSPKNMTQKIGRFVWRVLTFPRDSRVF